MNYRSNRKLKEIKNLIKNLKLKYINLSLSQQITVFWSVLWIISLFFPWIINNWNSIKWNSFNSITWNIWYLLLFVFLLSILVIISNNYKEKIKLYSDLNFKTHFIIINSWLITIAFSIISLSFAIWLWTIWQDIINWNWPILSMTSGVIILIGWLMIRKEYKKNNSEIILEKLSQDREKNKEKNNMTLPF